MLLSLIFLAVLESCNKYFENVPPSVSTVKIEGAVIGSDALTIDDKGNIYASDNVGTSPDPFNGNGKTVYKITQRGERTIFADNLEGGPAGSCFDGLGNFFVCTFRDGKLIKIKPNGTRQVFAEGLEGPIQVVTDKRNNLYVSVAGFGDVPGTKIYKFTPQGTKTVLADLFALGGIALSGMTIDKDENLYVTNYVNGKIIKVTSQGAAKVFADLGTSEIPYTPFTSYLAYANDNVFATGLVANRIYKISMAGKASVIAGTGAAGGTDGSPSTATFDSPNGIAVEPFGNVLYLSESNPKRLRRIISLKQL